LNNIEVSDEFLRHFFRAIFPILQEYPEEMKIVMQTPPAALMERLSKIIKSELN